MNASPHKWPKPYWPAVAIAGLVLLIAVLAIVRQPSAQPLPPDPRPDTPTVTPIDLPVQQIALPGVTWEPETLVVAMSPGEIKIVTVTGTSDGNVPATTVLLSPELQPYVTVTPVQLPRFDGVSQQALELTFDVPDGTGFQKISGSLVLKGPKVVVQRGIPVRFNIWPQITDAELGVGLNYPPDWIQRGTLSFSNVENFSPIVDVLNSNEGFFGIVIERDANPSLLPIFQWYSVNVASNLPAQPEIVETIQLFNRQALRIIVPQVGPYVHVYIPNGSDIITVTYRGYTPSFDDIYQSMLSSLTF